MAQAEKDNRIVLKEKEARAKLLEGAQAVYESVTTTYGPKGRNVLIEKPFGRPLLTRDGVTVARDTYFKDRAKNMGAQVLIEASETTNRIAGDGTSATVALGYNLLSQGDTAIATGIHPMEVKDIFLKDQQLLLDDLKKITKPTKPSQLKEVATVSAGDPLLGQLIAEAIEYVGPDGGIITEKSYVQDVEREYVDGYYLQTGFEALQSGKKELVKPAVIVATRRLSSAQDAIEILNNAAETLNIQRGNIPRFLFIGNIEDAAYHTIVANINQGVIDAVIIKTPPQFGNMAKDLLEDIAIYAGCEPIGELTNVQEFDSRYLGVVDKVVASKNDATLFADNTHELTQDRIASLKEQLETEVSDAVVEKVRDRISKLEGKIALFRIGGATDTSKEEKEFRVEDAIQATRAAYQHGVVPGGGITLVNLCSNKGLSIFTVRALQYTFKQLLINANISPEVGFNKLTETKPNEGYNLRTGKIVDMVKAGILDPALVTEQTIINATQAAADALTVGSLLIFEDAEK